MTCDGVDLSESSNLVKQMTFWSLDSNPWNCGSSGTDRYFNILSFSYDFNGFQINKLTIADYHLPIVLNTPPRDPGMQMTTDESSSSVLLAGDVCDNE